MITLTIKKAITRFRKINTFVVVVVTIEMTDGVVAEKTRKDMSTESFVSNVNHEISESKALKDTGVELESVPEVTCERCGK